MYGSRNGDAFFFCNVQSVGIARSQIQVMPSCEEAFTLISQESAEKFIQRRLPASVKAARRFVEEDERDPDSMETGMSQR